jgi:hypothetical protein
MKQILKENNFFRTNELSLAATLQSMGYEIDSVEKNNDGKATFLVRRDSELDDAVRLFWLRRLKIDPLSFFESLKIIKSLLYQ